MGQAAQQSGMTIEYCMALPRQGLMSLTIPAVTHARVSEDFANPQVFFFGQKLSLIASYDFYEINNFVKTAPVFFFHFA